MISLVTIFLLSTTTCLQFHALSNMPGLRQATKQGNKLMLLVSIPSTSPVFNSNGDPCFDCHANPCIDPAIQCNLTMKTVQE